MGPKRLVFELIGALLLARFAMAIGGVQAEEVPCAEGLPALVAEASITEHETSRCTVVPGDEGDIGGYDGSRR